MAKADKAHQARVEEFQDDLRHLTTINVIRKHITTGRPVALADGTYYELRNRVADHFEIHPSTVIIVGSCRTGFSLKPQKRYVPFANSSDVDIAIVSSERFDDYWDRVFEHSRTDRLWSKSKRYRTFLRELFKGWLWPRRLPPSQHFAEALKWVEFEDLLGRQQFNGFRSVGARLYRSWERLEAYQSIHVTDCQQALLRSA